ncbi:hypothetical protein O181_007861 [Austropuccinia psidii MF-1]|uniref:Tf2-1-like SH3-like domain-containing protein n=1 Tax=Austropuccinia psidii MF-1 TaxID=1389203 RepID=A0A9Q3GI03_9BASI|nr:hypothetical protein [Austropuccinia psidii MF-1]
MYIHPTAKDFHDIWKRECDTAATLTDEEKKCNKQSFNNRKGTKKMRDKLVVPFTIIRSIGGNSVEVQLTEGLSRKHPVFPVILVKPYHKTGEDRFTSSNVIHTPQEIVEADDSPVPVKKSSKTGNSD